MLLYKRKTWLPAVTNTEKLSKIEFGWRQWLLAYEVQLQKERFSSDKVLQIYFDMGLFGLMHFFSFYTHNFLKVMD